MTDQATRIVPAGWYEDPASTAHVRWWNGMAWTEHTTVRPTASPQPDPTPVAAVVEDVVAAPGIDDTATADRIAEVRELERQYGIGTAEHGVIAPDTEADLRAAAEPEIYRPSWRDEGEVEEPRRHRRARRRATASSWLIALWPVFTLVTLIVAGYLYIYVSAEPRLVGIPVILGVVIVPLLLTIVWAMADARKLKQFGHQPASPAFALLGPLVYLIARRTRVRGNGPLVTLLVLTLLAVGGPVAAWYTDVAAPVVTALKIQQTVSEALIGSGTVRSVSCPIFIESTTPGTLYTCDAVLPDGTSHAVWVSIDTTDGEFSYSLSLR